MKKKLQKTKQSKKLSLLSKSSKLALLVFCSMAFLACKGRVSSLQSTQVKSPAAKSLTLSDYSLFERTSLDQGHIDKVAYEAVGFSKEKAYLYGLLADLAYENDTDKIKEVLGKSIFMPEDVFFYNESGESAFLMIKGSSVILSVRGTDSFVDWLHNLDTTPTKFAFNKAMRGYESPAKKILTWIIATLKEHSKSEADQFYNIALIGHSRGGAIAKIITRLLEDEQYLLPLHTYTFGAPRGESFVTVLSSKSGEFIYNMRLWRDPIAMLPLRVVTYGHTYTYKYDAEEQLCELTDVAVRLVLSKKEKHRLKSYLGCLRELLK